MNAKSHGFDAKILRQANPRLNNTLNPKIINTKYTLASQRLPSERASEEPLRKGSPMNQNEIGFDEIIRSHNSGIHNPIDVIDRTFRSLTKSHEMNRTKTKSATSLGIESFSLKPMFCEYYKLPFLT